MRRQDCNKVRLPSEPVLHQLSRIMQPKEDLIGVARSVSACLHEMDPSFEGQASVQPGVAGRDVIRSDPNTSGQVMELVKALTRTMNSITVCATIHSPSPQTFELFDKVIILLSGRIVYFGNNGERPLTQCDLVFCLACFPCHLKHAFQASSKTNSFRYSCRCIVSSK